MPLNKQVKFAELDELIAATISDGMIVAVGGFGLSGNPFELISSLARVGRKNLVVVSNNMGTETKGLGQLLAKGLVAKVLASYVGDNAVFAQQYLNGEVEVEFNPQGTLAERLRAGGAGIPAFYTASGVGTLIAEGKPSATFDGVDYILERAIVADVGLVHAHTGDVGGNLVYRRTARNFNPLCAESGVVTIAEVESLGPLGSVDPERVMTPGVHVDHIVEVGPGEKVIENRTVRQRTVQKGEQV